MVYTNRSPIDKLKDYPTDTYLFHGSFNPEIDILRPMPATDSNEGEGSFNVDEAIFASDDAASTVDFALFKNWEKRSDIPEDLRKNGWSIQWTDSGCTAYVTSIWQPILHQLKGYIYILPREAFLEVEGNQFKSKERITPVDTIEVSIDDYYALGGRLEWVW